MTSFFPVKLAHYIAVPEDDVDNNLSPVMFIHGMTGCKEMWGKIPQIVANETKRKSYVLDLRNHGSTEWTNSFDFDMLSDDLLYFMDTHKIQNAILIGHSMGGILSIRTALKHPERVKALVVEDMIVGKMSPHIINYLKIYVLGIHNFIRQIPAETEHMEVTKMCFEEMFKKQSKNSKERMRKNFSFDDFSPFVRRDANGKWNLTANSAAISKALDNPDTLMSEPEGVYTGPVSFIYGTLSDFRIWENEHRIKKHFPKAELTPIEGSGHNITLEDPTELTKAFLDFLSKVHL